MSLAVQELRHPNLNSAQRKRHCRHSQRSGDECPIPCKSQNCAPLWSLLQRIKVPALWFFQERHNQGKHKTRHRGEVERKPPSMSGRQITAEQIPSSGSHGNREIENTQIPPTFLLFKKIGNKSRRNGDECCLTYPHQRVTNQQFGVGMRDRSEQSQAAPEDRSQNNNQLPRIAIRQRPHKRRRNHVEAKKSASQISNLLFGEMKLILHQRLHRKQHIAVRVIEQIERCQNDQRRPRLQVVLGHRSREYSMQQPALCRDSWTTVH